MYIWMRLVARTPPPPDYEAGPSLRLLLRRRMQYAVDSEISLGMFLVSFLQVLCISCNFMLVLCKLSASFLLVLFFRSFLQYLCKSSVLFLASGALGECQNLVQKRSQDTLTIVQNGIWTDLRTLKIMKHWPRTLQLASRAQGCFRNEFWSRQVISIFWVWRICGVILDSIRFGRGAQIDIVLKSLETN